MTLAGLYFTTALLSLIATLTALIKARRLYWAVPVYFFSGWLTGELAIIHMAMQLGFTGLVALSGGLESSTGVNGLLLFALSWAGLLYLHLQSSDTAAVMEAALRRALGDNYRGDIPAGRQGVMRASINSSSWLKPFSMRRDGVIVHRNISYGEHGKRNQLDVFQPAVPREGGFPVLLQVHGGGWMIGEKEQQGQPLMYHLAQRGWLCVACNYRLSPTDTFPSHIIDVKKTIAWVRENAAQYGGNADFIAITGGSAGGHLTALAALTPNHEPWQPGFESADTRVQAAVPFYGVFDFLDRDSIRGDMSMQDLLAKHVLKVTPDEDRQLWEDASPMSHVSAAAPPMYVVQGTHDTLVWVEEARSFVRRLHEASEEVVAYAELPGAQHAFEVFHSVRTDHAVNSVTEFLEWCYARRDQGQTDSVTVS